MNDRIEGWMEKEMIGQRKMKEQLDGWMEK